MKKIIAGVFLCLCLAGCSKQPPVPEDATPVGKQEQFWTLWRGEDGTVTEVSTKDWIGYVEGKPHSKREGWCFLLDGYLWLEQPDGGYARWKIKN